MTQARFVREVSAALERVTDLQIRAQTASPEDAQAMLVEALEELTTAFAELETAQEELRTQNELLAAAEVLVASERDRYKDLFEFAPNGYLVTDAEGVVVQANEAARRLLNVGPRYLVNKPLTVFVAAEDRDAYLTQLTALQRGESAGQSTLRFAPRGDGAEPRTVDVTVVPFRDPETRTPLLRWQLRDATDQWHSAAEVNRLNVELETLARKQKAERGGRLEEGAADRRLRFLADSAALFLSTLDSDATLGHVGRLVVPHFGDWCFVVFADPDAPARTRPLVLAEEGHAELVAALGPSPTARPRRALVVADTAAPPAELSPAEADRVELFAALGWSAALWLPLTAGGETIGALAVGSAHRGRWTGADVAAAVDLAGQAAAAVRNAGLYRRLLDADRRKDEFLSVLAHELRNPLTPMLNAVQILHLRGATDPILRRAYAMIDRQATRLNRLIDDLLDVGRIAQGKVRLRPEVLDLGVAAGAAAESVRPKAADRGVKLVVKLPDEPLMIEADPGRLDQIVANLLDNAVKYTEAGGTVTLTIARDGDKAVVRVGDTGIGISPEVLPSVFDLYAQAERNAGDEQGGLGIGLAVVQQLVRLHAGTVTARSDGPGHGSEFVVTLPVAALPPPGENGPVANPKRATGR